MIIQRTRRDRRAGPRALRLAGPALLSLASAAAAASAVAADEGPPLVRWPDVARLLDRHPALAVAASGVAAAEADLAAAGVWDDPTIGAGAGRAASIEGSETRDVWSVEAGLDVPWPGRLGSRVRAARAERDAAAWDEVAVRREVRREVEGLFWEIVAGGRRLEALTASVLRTGEVVEAARARVDLGEARTMDLTRLEIERERLDVRRAREDAILRAQVGRLDRWLGDALPDGFRAEGTLEALPALPSLEDALARARADHPVPRAATARERAAEARLDAERASRIPAVGLRAFREREIDATTWGGAVELPLPLWNRNAAGVERARAAHRAARDEAALAVARFEDDVRRRHADAATAYATAQALARDVLPRARDVASAIETLYRVGEVGVTDVLDARRALIDVEAERLDALLAAQLARLELETLIGGDDHAE